MEIYRAVDSLTRRQTSSGSGSDAGDQILNLLSNPFESSVQAQAFWASLVTSISVTLILALLFSLIRPRHKLVYAPKIKYADHKHAPAPLGNGIFDWVVPVMKTKEDLMVEKFGLDAAIFLRFTRMLRNIFLALSVIGCLVMIPVNVADTRNSHIAKLTTFQMMTPLNVYGKALWSQVVCAYVIDIIVAYFVWHNYKHIRDLRRTYFQTQDYQRSLHARTLLITGLPAAMRTDDGVIRVTDEVNPTGHVPKAAVGRNVRVLPDLIKEHETTVKKLESILAKYLKDPNKLPAKRPTMHAPRRYRGNQKNGQVDAIEYLTSRISELEAQIKDVREKIDKRDALAYGFASWDSIENAHIVAYAARKKHPHGTKIDLAPRPNDIIWENLALSKAAQRRKYMMNVLWVTILTLLWMPINAAIAIFLSNLANLASVWKGFNTSLQAHATWWAIVQGVAAPGITSLVYLVLPIIFRRLSIRAGDVTKTAREHHVLSNLYNFFTFNNLIVFSLFSAIWQFVTAVINAKNTDTSLWNAIKAGQFYLKVMTALCSISPFWLTWLLQRNLGAAIDIAQLWTLFYIWFARTFLAPTPRQKITWTAPPWFDYASYYNYFLFYATIALCFSTLQPLVLPVTCLYFSIDSVLKKYLLMYVFITKTESGGQAWRFIFDRLIFAAILSNIIIGLVVVGRGFWSMVFALVPLPILMTVFMIYCIRTFDNDMKYYVRTGMRDQERLATTGQGKQSDKISTKFGHPALYKPLMTPMVHARAQHVLTQVYRGRLNSDTGRSMAFSGIAMEPMDGQGHAQQTDASFEFVPEGQQDFSYYKNRPDFREEGGEMYGKPEDLISERSQTPKSFLGPMTTWSEAQSREPSPPGNGGAISRKAVGDAGHPIFRPGHDKGFSSGDYEPETADLGLTGTRYPDSHADDQTNLLHDAGGMGAVTRLPAPVDVPSGEFISMDRWRKGSSGYGPLEQDEEHPGSYDYFRGRR